MDVPMLEKHYFMYITSRTPVAENTKRIDTTEDALVGLHSSFFLLLIHRSRQTMEVQVVV